MSMDSPPGDTTEPVPPTGGAAGTPAATQPAPVQQPAPPARPLPLHHVGIAVQSMVEALAFYEGQLHMPVVERRTLSDRALEIAFVQSGNTLLELMHPTDPETTVARFLERRGPGLHHLCFGTPDIDAHLRELKENGVELIDSVARPGAHGDVAFLQPASAHGVLVELIQEGRFSTQEAP